MPDMTINNIYIKNQIDNSIIQMKDISKQINNMNNRIEFLNSDNNLANNNEEIRPKTINVIFKTISGKAYNFYFY